MSGQYKVAWLCEALLVSRSGYYDWKKRRSKPGPRQVENTRLRERIREEFARSRQTYGSPRLAHALGCPGRRNRIARLMRRSDSSPGNAPNIEPLPLTAATADPSPLTGSEVSPCNGSIRSGPPMPLACSPVKAGCIWSRSWMCSPAALSVGPCSQILDAPLVIAALRMALAQRRPGQTTHHPLRSRRSVRQRRLPANPRPTRPNRFHELAKATATTTLLSSPSGAVSNTNSFTTTASPPWPKLAPPSSITSKPSTTAPDSTPVLPTKAQPTLNPN